MCEKPLKQKLLRQQAQPTQEKSEIVYSPPPEKTWRDYFGETVIGLSIMILFNLLYIYSIVKKEIYLDGVDYF